MKLLLIPFLLSIAFIGAPPKNVNYRLDLAKSKLYWQDPEKHHEGFILFSAGELSGPVNSMPTRGTFTLDMHSMRSTDGKNASERKKTDDKLRSPEYFEVDKHPQATVKIKQIQPEKTASVYKVSGELTIKGQSAPLVFTSTLKRSGNLLRAEASLSISRKRFGINKAKQRYDVLTSIHDSLSDDLIPIKLDLHFFVK